MLGHILSFLPPVTDQSLQSGTINEATTNETEQMRADATAGIEATQNWLPPVAIARQLAKYSAYNGEELLEATDDFLKIKKLVDEGKYKWTAVDLQHLNAIMQELSKRTGKDRR